MKRVLLPGLIVSAALARSDLPPAKVKLNPRGTTCVTGQSLGCVNTATDPTVQAGVQTEQTKLNNDVGPFHYYPVVSAGFSYKFR